MQMAQSRSFINQIFIILPLILTVMIDQKHEEWIRKKFPIFYTIKVNLQQEFTPTELDSLEGELLTNHQEVSKQNQKTLKKLKKLANQTEKQYRSNKELYNILSTVKSQQIHQITLAHKKIECIKPLEKRKFQKLCEIDLAFNKVQDISPLVSSSLPSLTYFNLSQNNVKILKDLQLCAWPKLKILNLSFNQVTSIEPLSNGEFPNLQKMDMSQNFITNFSSFYKSSSWELKFLSFRNNKMNSLKKIQRFCFTKLSEINLKGNPISNPTDIEKLQTTTVRNKKFYQSEKKISQQKAEQFIKYSYKLFYSKLIHKVKKEDFFLELLQEKNKKYTKKHITSSKHVEFAIVDEYKEPEQKIQIMPTKKLHFD